MSAGLHGEVVGGTPQLSVGPGSGGGRACGVLSVVPTAPAAGWQVAAGGADMSTELYFREDIKQVLLSVEVGSALQARHSLPTEHLAAYRAGWRDALTTVAARFGLVTFDQSLLQVGRSRELVRGRTEG